MPAPIANDSKQSTMTIDIAVAIIIFVLIASIFGIYIDRTFAEYRGFLEWFYSKNWHSINTVFAIVFTFINFFLFASIIILFRRIARIKKMPSQETAQIHTVTVEEEVRDAWDQIKKLGQSESSSDWNMAVIRADALLDDTLRRKGYDGETIKERLDIVDPSILKSIDRVWSAHRLRNMIAHDPEEQHTRETITHALNSYEQAFRELGMIKNSA